MKRPKSKANTKTTSTTVTVPSNWNSSTTTTTSIPNPFSGFGQVYGETTGNIYGTYNNQPIYDKGWKTRGPIFAEIANLLDVENILTIAQIEFMDELYTTGDDNNARIAMQMFKTLTNDYIKNLKRKERLSKFRKSIKTLQEFTKEKEEVLEKEMD